MPLPADHEQRLARARLALEGLSVGDAFGDDFEFADLDEILKQIQKRELPPLPWRFTDDTNMALSIFQILSQHGEINQDALAASFARYYDGARGYGAGAFLLLYDIKKGGDWRVLASRMFNNKGSFGNGAAMRIAPLGAYFASDDLSIVAEQAKLSAEITHTHAEGIAGAIAIAVATAQTWRLHQAGEKPDRVAFIDAVLPYIPPSEVYNRTVVARNLASETTAQETVSILGNGERESAQDTVPFALWCAGEYLHNYEEAIWQTASGGGDVDTTCAMVGGIVAMAVGQAGIPPLWIENREALPDWAFPPASAGELKEKQILFTSPTNHDQRLTRARLALEGLSVGDSFGGFFEFGSARRVSGFIQERKLPAAPWHFTDDSNMALSIFQILRQHGEINQDALVASFAQYFDRTRGYGMGARSLLTRIKAGEADWRSLTQKMFGSGSYGNGGAMRVAPVGAYFADADLSLVAQQAALSAEITHAHPEGIAGAIAVAVATALAWRIHDTGETAPTRQVFIDRIIPYIPAGEVRTNCEQARDLPDKLPLIEVIKTIGNGSGVIAQDTIPFVLWSAGENLTNYEEAIWQTASGGGDVDTTCAMVGGIVAMAVGQAGIPPLWIENREPLPDWAFVDQ